MNRLKFRIWCKGTSTNANFNKPRWIQPTDFILLKYYRCFQDVIESDDFIVQQYTGLQDRDGKEIYEGDIVKYARTKVESTEFAKGCFKNHLIQLGEEIGEILFIKPSFCLSFDHIRYDDIMPMCLAEHRYEVIGNVFENSELLHIVNNE